MTSILLKRILPFLIPFSLLFWYTHTQFEPIITLSTQNGLVGLYAVVGTIFGFVIGFVIQREWEIWTSLSESVRTEIDAVREMWKWSTYADPQLHHKAHTHLEGYLKSIVFEWHRGREEERSKSVDTEIDSLRGMLAHLSLSMGSLGVHIQSAFTDLVRARNQRLNFSDEHMPGLLKRTVIFAGALFIILSLFIAVDNIYLDFMFTFSIGLLAFVLMLVVDDLDNPFQPGAWHLTTKGYEILLTELAHHKPVEN